MPIVAAICVPHPPTILPQVGKGEEAKIAATTIACHQAMAFLAAAAPQAVVVISPHADMYADWFCISPGSDATGDFARFGAPQVTLHVRYDESLARAIATEAKTAGLPAGPQGQRHTELDHGTLIPLVFMHKAGLEVPLVRIGLSGLDFAAHYALGQCIAQAAGDKRVAIVASGDLSHKLLEDGPYGFAPEGPRLDAAICEALASGDFGALLAIDPVLADKGAECGLRSFVMMSGALDGLAVKASLLSYEGPFGVGYAVATLAPGGPDATRRFEAAAEKEALTAAAQKRTEADPWVQLARHSIEHYVHHRQRAPLPPNLPDPLMQKRAGVFVSIHKRGQLRGCIGTIIPVQPSVALEILHNAVAAATQDPRFAPITPDELDTLEIHVDVLEPPEDIAGPEALDVKHYGVIVSSGARRGLLLPDLDGVDTVAEQIDIARRKAGIPAGQPVQLQRFEVIRHE